MPPNPTSDAPGVLTSGSPVGRRSVRAIWRLGLPLALFSVLWLDLVRLLSGNWEAREQYARFLALAPLRLETLRADATERLGKLPK